MNIIYGILNALIWLIPGLYVVYTVKTSGLFHGAIVGTIGFVITYLIILSFLLYDPYQASYQIIYNALSVGFLCSLAAGVGELYAIKRANKDNG